jgi:hypothetical protein
MAAIPVKPEAVGRWHADEGTHNFDFFADDLQEHGYVPMRGTVVSAGA